MSNKISYFVDFTTIANIIFCILGTEDICIIHTDWNNTSMDILDIRPSFQTHLQICNQQNQFCLVS